MSLLHVADIHAHRPWMRWIASAAPRFTAIVIAGDCLNAFSDVRIEAQEKEVAAWLSNLPVPVIVCSGNHDVADMHDDAAWLRGLRGKGKVAAVDGDTVEIGGMRISVSGWLRPSWERPCDVVVYHAPPQGLPCAGDESQRDLGDSEVAKLLWEAPPRLFLAGHIHEPQRRYSWWPLGGDRQTLVLVPGVAPDEYEIPAYWVIDLAARRATHSAGDEVAF